MTRPRVVVLGAGFGGLWAVKSLRGTPVDVTLVDRNNYHTFFPLLYQVAAAELVPTDIAYPVRSLFRRARNVDVRMAEVTRIDLAARRVETSAGTLAYDALVVGLGSVPEYYGVPGAAEHAFPLRWMDDAVPLRHHLLTSFERAAATDDPVLRARSLTFAVVGGGPTGVEFSGALAELVHGPLLADFPRIDATEVRIVLLEGADALLGGMPSRLGRYAADRLRTRRVEVRLGARVDQVGAASVLLAGGEELATDTVVWTAGVRGDPLVAEWGLPVGKGGRVPVLPTLALADHPEVFVVGDLAYLEDRDGQPLPQVAQVAIQQGRTAARNVVRAASGRDPAPFVYRDPGVMAVIGRNAAAAHVAGRAFTGWVAWLLWLGVHIVWLIGFRNRALVLLNWGWNYAFFRRAVRLILPGTRSRVEHASRGPSP